MKTQKCENCSSLNSGEYGSGRFCSSKCARGFSTKAKRKDINEKVSLKGKGIYSKTGEKANGDVDRICYHCSTEFKVEYSKRKAKFCSTSCARANEKLSPDGVNSVVAWRQRVKAKSIEYKGGSCVICKYKNCNRSIQFHHLEPDKKDFGIGGVTYSWDRIKKELDKCILVCANCHGEIHDGLHNELLSKFGSVV